MKKYIIWIVIAIILLIVLGVWLFRAPAIKEENIPVNQVAQPISTQQVLPQTTVVNQENTVNVPATNSNTVKASATTSTKIISKKTINSMTIETTKEGSGPEIINGQTAEMQYVGSLSDGTIFDSTAAHGGAPFSFTLGAGQVIKGWDLGVLGMKVGESRTLIIPPALAYGDNGIGGVIPPNATLTFDVTLVGIK